MNSANQSFDILIREMSQSDIATIHSIHTQCLQTTLSHFYNEQQIQAWLAGRTPEGYWRSKEAGSPYLVASINNIVVGYANWMGDELMSLFVQPTNHKTGIGSALFEACDQKNRISRVKATLSAVDFYRRFGFVVDHEGFDVKRDVRIPHIFMRRSAQ